MTLRRSKPASSAASATSARSAPSLDGPSGHVKDGMLRPSFMGSPQCSCVRDPEVVPCGVGQVAPTDLLAGRGECHLAPFFVAAHRYLQQPAAGLFSPGDVGTER